MAFDNTLFKKKTCAEPTSLKMGVTKADRHCDLGCLFTESPDWIEKKKKTPSN